MSKWLLNTIGCCIIAALGFASWGGWCLYPHVTAMLDAARMPDLKPTLDKANGTLDAINAPCVGFHGSVTCGPLAQLSQTEKNIGIVAGQSALQVKQSGKLIDATSEAIRISSTDVGRLANALTGTANSATQTLQAAQASIQTINDRTPALIDAYTASGRDLDAMIQENRPSVKAVLVHVVGMTASGDVILSNGATVTTKAKDDYMKANTPWGKITARLWGGYDMASWLARNAH